MKTQPTAYDVPSVADELSDADLGDARRGARLARIAAAAQRSPGDSFPRQAESVGALEGTYRLLNNEHVSEEELLGSHAARTVRRASAYEEVLVLHDTSKFQFKGETHRAGLGYLPNKGQGFLGHFAFCTALDGRPLGVLGVETNFRGAKPKGRQAPSVAQADPARESLRWPRLAQHASLVLAGHARPIHVMDREADSYELFHALVEDQTGFVIRLFRRRAVVKSKSEVATSKTLFGSMDAAPLSFERTVSLSPRAKKGSNKRQKIYPWRRKRSARLVFRAHAFTIRRPRSAALTLPAQMTLNFVAVREVDAPEGQAPVSWNLVTTEPIDTPEQVARVVDIYRRRWLIEEFFKALKTGCAYEKRQLSNRHAFLVSLAIFSTVAWRLLLLRWLSRDAPDEPAERVLTRGHLQLLNHLPSKYNIRLPDQPTVRDALSAIARLGGHLKNNGDPGWITLGRGFDNLLMMELGWIAAIETLAQGSP